MRSHRAELHFETERPSQILNITDRVEHAVLQSGIRDGLALVYPMHTSAAVYISDSDFSLTDDFEKVMERLVPTDGAYRHDRVDPKRNAAGHLKAILAGHSVTLPVTDGVLDLGTYQTLYYFELDGQRPKEVLVKIIGE